MNKAHQIHLDLNPLLPSSPLPVHVRAPILLTPHAYMCQERQALPTIPRRNWIQRHNRRPNTVNIDEKTMAGKQGKR